MIRALHIIGPLGYGGAEIALVRILRRLSGSDIEFSFTAFPERPGVLDREVLSLGGRLVPLPLWTRPSAYVLELRRAMRRGRFDLVSAQHPEFAGYMLALAREVGIRARLLHVRNTRFETTERGLRGLGYRTFGRRMVLGALTRGVAVSAPAAEYVFGPRWREDGRFAILHDPIDLEPFEAAYDRHEVRRELGIPRGAVVIGHVGRFQPQKNHARLLGIAARAMSLSPAAWLLLVGDGPLRAGLARRADELGVASRTVFAGGRADIARMLSAMDVFVMPSLHEGLGLALLEAQAASVPVVYSDVIPREAVVRPEAAVALDLAASDEVWARTVLEMASRREPASREGLEALKRSDFNAEIAAQGLAREYRRAVEEAGSSEGARRSILDADSPRTA